MLDGWLCWEPYGPYQLLVAGLLAAEPEGAAPIPAAESSSSSTAPEIVFYEGSGAPAELALSLLLGVFVITLPLTIASVGRR